MTTAVDRLEYHFSFHGVTLCYRTSSPWMLSSAAVWLRDYRLDQSEGDRSLTIHFEQVPDRQAVFVSHSPAARRLFSGTKPAIGSSMRALWQCEMWEDRRRLIVDVRDRGVLVIDGQGGTAHGYFFRPEAMHSDRLEIFFHYALAELLKSRGILTLDAAALEYQGRGVLVAGHRPCGKTTVLLSLLRSGYRYLSDDHPMLLDSGTRLQLLGCPLKVDVTDQTVAFFPELREATTGLRRGAYKKSFYAEDIFSSLPARSCEPTMILFPQITNMPHSCLEPLAKDRALDALISGEPFVRKELEERECRMLASLVQRTACYRLHFGRDVLDLPMLITPLLERH